MTLTRKTTLAAVAIVSAGALIVVGGTVAAAAYTGVDAKGQVHACWRNVPSSLRIVDHFPCKVGETAISWNQSGVQGDRGLTGAAGPAGADGASGASSTGAPGLTGAAGPTGADGAIGARGPAGADGANGADGAAGANGSALSVYNGATRLGTLTAATPSQVSYLDANGVVRSASPDQVVTQVMFSDPSCQGTPYLYAGFGNVAGDFRVEAAAGSVAAGMYSRTGPYTSQAIASYFNGSSCSALNSTYNTAPFAALTTITVH